MWALAIFILLAIQDTDKERMMKVQADQWLALVDAGDYGKAYDALSESTRKELPRAEFVKTTEELRDYVGKLQMRKFKSVEFVTNPPGPPEGEYSAVQYETAFQNRPVTEAVAFRLEDGKWGVIGYYMR